MYIPYLSRTDIENAADALLIAWEGQSKVPAKPPIPVDKIVETYLDLDLEVLDLSLECASDDVFGAIWVDDLVIAVDRRLDPVVFPEREGRFHFTLAHEAGHWELHRRSYIRARNRPTYICRTSQAKRPIEWQADFFAACLLMPRYLVRASWKEAWGDESPFTTNRVRMEAEGVRTAMRRPGAIITLDERAEDNALLDWFSRPFAREFKVSAMAMRIRLEELGLLRRVEQ
jgi:hypothetical protein